MNESWTGFAAFGDHGRKRSRSFLAGSSQWFLSLAVHCAVIWVLATSFKPRVTGGFGSGTDFVIEAAFFDAPQGGGDGPAGLPEGADSAVFRTPLDSEESDDSSVDSEERTLVRSAQPVVRPIPQSIPDDLPAIVESDNEPPPPAASSKKKLTTQAVSRYPTFREAPPRGKPNARGNGRGKGGGSGSGAGTGTTSFFGVKGEGSRFVFVIDRSSSMVRHHALSSAGDEMLASLDHLPPTALVQAVFFNERPLAAQSAGTRPALLRNSDRQRALLEQFTRGIDPDGGTDRLAALELALGLEPDVIFLLTDSEEPRLFAADLDRLRRRNRGEAAIHVVEFAIGPLLEAENFLTRLARENHGSYRYLDLERLAEAEDRTTEP